jgi:hypothetical protein
MPHMKQPSGGLRQRDAAGRQNLHFEQPNDHSILLGEARMVYSFDPAFAKPIFSLMLAMDFLGDT